jgi:hypothetical protein
VFDMRRRDFIGLFGAAAAWPLAAGAQQAAKLPTIGVLGTATATVWSPWTTAFVRRLRELGWIGGRTVTRGETRLALCPDRGRVCPARSPCHSPSRGLSRSLLKANG